MWSSSRPPATQNSAAQSSSGKLSSPLGCTTAPSAATGGRAEDARPERRVGWDGSCCSVLRVDHVVHASTRSSVNFGAGTLQRSIGVLLCCPMDHAICGSTKNQPNVPGEHSVRARKHP